MKKLLVVLGIIAGLLSSLSADFAVNSNDLKAVDAPHYYEFDISMNPNQFYWCGQTALKIALEAKNVYKTLDEIHNDFISLDNKNHLGQYFRNNCSGHWCAFPKLLKYSVSKYRSEENVNVYYSRYEYTNKDNAFNFIKNQINKGNLVIIFSDKFYHYTYKHWYRTCHFFVVNSYNTRGRNKWLYVRDPENDNPDYWFADKAFKFDDIWKNAKHKSSLVLLVIK